MDKSQIPERVVFQNLKDGNVFFDCSPQEARTAINAVKTFRDTGYTSELSQTIKDAEKLAIESTDHEQKTIEGQYVLPFVIADGFAQIEKEDLRVTHVFMNALNYADFRKGHREDLDIETQAVMLKLGQMATFWGARLIVTRDLVDGDVRLVADEDPDKKMVYQLNLKGESIKHKDRLDLIMEHLGIETPVAK